MVSGQAFKSSARWRQWILNPPLLGGIISLGAHGILFAAGPTFSALNLDTLSQPDPIAEARRVPLVALSPEEQQRLPDFSNSYYSFNSLEDLQAADPFPSPGNDDFANDADDDIGFSLSPGRPTSGFQIPFGVSPFQPRVQDIPTPPPPAENDSGGSQSSTPTPNGGANEDTSAQPPAGARPNGEGTAITPQVPVLSEPSAADLERRPSNPAASGGGSAPPAIAASGAGNPDDSLAERIASYTYNSAGTTEADAEVAVERWLALGKELSGQPEVTVKRVELPVEYGRRPCLARAPHPGLVGALVDAEGKLAKDPELLRSTGYPFLNEQVLQFIKTLDFRSVEQFTAYQFSINVNYDVDVCINLGQVPESSNADPNG